MHTYNVRIENLLSLQVSADNPKEAMQKALYKMNCELVCVERTENDKKSNAWTELISNGRNSTRAYTIKWKPRVLRRVKPHMTGVGKGQAGVSVESQAVSASCRDNAEKRRGMVVQAVRNGTHLLFHGSDGGIKGKIRSSAGSKISDFGRGFYTGNMLEQAENRISNKAGGVLYAYRYDLSDVDAYEFTDDVLWALFIGYFRQKNLDFRNYAKLKQKIDEIAGHDVIIGYIADDKISSAYNDFLAGNTTDVCLTKCLRLVKYGKQYVFKNNHAVEKCLKPFESYAVTKQMRQQSIEWNRRMKHTMDKDIEQIKRDCRREGRTVYECLEDFK